MLKDIFADHVSRAGYKFSRLCLSTVTFELADLWRWFYAYAMCIGHDDSSLKVKSQRDLIDGMWSVLHCSLTRPVSFMHHFKINMWPT